MITTIAPPCPTTSTATTTTTTTCRTCIADPADMVVVVDVSPARFKRHSLRHRDGKTCLNRDALLLKHYTVAYIRQLLVAVAPRMNPSETGVRVAVVLFAAQARVQIGFKTEPGGMLLEFDAIDWKGVAADLAPGGSTATRLHTPFKLMRETVLNVDSTEKVDPNFRRFAKPVLILTITGGVTDPAEANDLATEVRALQREGATALPTVVGYADEVRALCDACGTIGSSTVVYATLHGSGDSTGQHRSSALIVFAIMRKPLLTGPHGCICAREGKPHVYGQPARRPCGLQPIPVRRLCPLI